MKEKMFEIYREHRQGKWDHERDWEKYPPPKWVIEMYASKESFDK
ncbi:MAG: hypothetical protein OXU27_08660 [Candidatus Poribacteria bacterium]|nr:hypothetical protein [Candidatus Poribacteria bacterium]MDD9974064.1 hypothetical protein [Candidatus Poribacteria bacterium]MDE0326879.1 hypothetical protein [Candidatus Poribacteria bacterium]